MKKLSFIIIIFLMGCESKSTSIEDQIKQDCTTSKSCEEVFLRCKENNRERFVGFILTKIGGETKYVTTYWGPTVTDIVSSCDTFNYEYCISHEKHISYLMNFSVTSNFKNENNFTLDDEDISISLGSLKFKINRANLTGNISDIEYSIYQPFICNIADKKSFEIRADFFANKGLKDKLKKLSNNKI